MARTLKARALGGALRQARDGKGLLLRELAAMINKDIGVLSRWETGERTPKPEQVAQILTKLDVDGDRYDEIMSLAYGTNEPHWVATIWPEQRQQMIAYLDWEQKAAKIVEVAPLLVPGLLQTGDYIRGIMTADGVPPDDTAARVRARTARRNVITRANPAELLVLLGQSALNQDIGGPQTTIGQLRHLLEMAARPNVGLRIVPDRSGWHPGLEGMFSIMAANRTTPRNIVFVETRKSMLILHEDADVDAYQQAVDQILRTSLSPESSAKFIAEVLTRLEYQHGR